MTLETAAATDRRVPFDEAAEQHVLGCLLTDRDAIFKIADLLRVDDFYLARHQRVYAAAQALFALRDESANAQLRHITATLQTNYEHLTERMERPFDLSGIPSGFRELDYYTEGFTTGDLIVLAARPSVGKTSLALGMAYNMARRGHRVLLFSLEMDAKQIVSRFLALNSRMDLLALRTGNIIDTDAAA